MQEHTAMITRCAWVTDDPLYIAYHDTEWGVPVHDDRTFFEALVLDGAQAGLSWLTILKRREGYRAAFDHFDPEVVARYDEERIAALQHDPRIIRNQQKIRSAVNNARAFLRIQDEFGSFDSYIWRFVGGAPRYNYPATLNDVPAETAESRSLSQDLKQRGFSFVGPIICYALMQACGLVNDHTTDCFRCPPR
jgi:DNA-3-methyladenine glycosylase I